MLRPERARLAWSTPEAVTFRALPWPSFRIVEAKLSDVSATNVVLAPDAEIDLSLIELLLGRIAPTHVALFAPTISLNLDRTMSVGRNGASAAMAVMRGLAPLSSVSLTDGVVRVTSPRQGFDTVLESVREGSAVCRCLPGFTVDLSAVWRGAPLFISGSLDDPQWAGRGRASPLNVRIGSALGELTFGGAFAAGATPGAAGELSVSSRALAEAFRLLGLTPSPLLAAADIAISGVVKATPRDIIFDDATITAGGQTLQGPLRFARNGGRLSVSGSLDSAHLSLPSTAQPFLAPDGGWSSNSSSPPRPPGTSTWICDCRRNEWTLTASASMTSLSPP